MARPRRPVGTHGTIVPVGQIRVDGRWVNAPEGAKPERYRARVEVRDRDGRTREVARYAPTKARAKTLLEVALRDRTAPRRTEELDLGMSFGQAGEVWLAQVARPDSGLADSTRQQYREAWDRWIARTPFAAFTLAEANAVPRIRAFLQEVADQRGTGAAATTKSLISSVLGLAVTDGVLETSAARLVKPAKRATPAEPGEDSTRDRRLLEAGWQAAQIRADHTRAFTAAERQRVIDYARVHAATGPGRRGDLADLVALMAAMGPRIEEAVNVRWEGVDLVRGTVHIPGTKTTTSDRVLAAAPWLVEVLGARWEAAGKPVKGFVFHAPMGGPDDRRDLRATTRGLRRLFDEAGVPWAIPHTFRRTVASLLDAAGVPLAQIADYMGHSDPSMTARVYLGRRGDTSLAASKL